MANAAEDKPIGLACGAGGGRNESLPEDYWTEERRAQAEHRARAKPLPMPKAGGGERPATTGEALPKGPPGSTPGHKPHSHGDEKSSAPYLELRDGGAEVDVSDPLKYPWQTVGKLSYTQNGKPDWGSGALISPNIVLTAGHCLYDKDNGGKSIGVEFYPSWGVGAQGRDYKKDPFYKFNCSYLAWRLAWSEDSNLAYDYGLAWIDAAPGNHLGWLGYAWNQTTQGRTWTAYGYPPATPNALTSGGTMKAVVGRNAPSPIPGMIAMTNNNMLPGASGGPWITTDPVNTNPNDHWPYHANGVNCRLYGPSLIACSPYFTQELGELMEWISNPANRK
jgi:V8-like Glu-specific endopeptidase